MDENYSYYYEMDALNGDDGAYDHDWEEDEGEIPAEVLATNFITHDDDGNELPF